MEYSIYSKALISLVWMLGSILIAAYIWYNEHKYEDGYPSRWFTVAYVMATLAGSAFVANLPGFGTWHFAGMVAWLIAAVVVFLIFFRRKEKCYWLKFGPHQNLTKITVAICLFLGMQAVGEAAALMIYGICDTILFYNEGKLMDASLALGVFMGDLIVLLFFYKIGWANTSWGSVGKPDRLAVCLMMVVLCVGFAVPLGYLEDLSHLTDEMEHDFDIMEHNVFGVLGICLAGPIAEEVCDRGIVMGELLVWTKRPWVAIVGSALIFGITHMNPIQIFSASIAGILLGWLYYRTGSIVPGIIVHIVNNSLSTAKDLLLATNYKLPMVWMDVVLCTMTLIVFYFALRWCNKKFDSYAPLSAQPCTSNTRLCNPEGEEKLCAESN